MFVDIISSSTRTGASRSSDRIAASTMGASMAILSALVIVATASAWGLSAMLNLVEVGCEKPMRLIAVKWMDEVK